MKYSACLLLFAVGAAAADTHVPEAVAVAAPGLRLRAVGLHQAARLVAEIDRVNVIAVGRDPALTIDLPEGDAAATLDRLAAAAGVTHVARRPIQILVEAMPSRWSAPSPPDGRPRVSLDFLHVAGARLGELFGEILKTKPDALGGDATIVVRNVSTAFVRGVLRDLLVADRPAAAPAPFCPPPATPPMHVVKLPCVDAGTLAVAAIARRGERRVALVRSGGYEAIVGRGDSVGREDARVDEIGDDFVTVGGRKLALPPLR